MKSIRDIPLIGPIIRMLFSERGQIALTYVFFLGVACWLSGYFLEIATLTQAGKYLVWTSMALIGSWILVVMLMIGLDRIRGKDQRAGFENPSQKEILERFARAVEREEAELSLQFNSREVKFVSMHERDDFFTLSVTGGQSDPVDAEISEYLRSCFEHPFRIAKGKNLWRRRVVFGDRMKRSGSADPQ